MYKHPLFLSHFLILIFTITLQHAGDFLSWYYMYQWFDVLMHFLGGLWVSTIALWFFYFYPYKKFNIKISRALLLSFVSVAVVGILWEIYEVTVGAPREVNFVADVSVDLIMDMVGALVGWFYVYYLFLKGKTNET